MSQYKHQNAQSRLSRLGGRMTFHRTQGTRRKVGHHRRCPPPLDTPMTPTFLILWRGLGGDPRSGVPSILYRPGSTSRRARQKADRLNLHPLEAGKRFQPPILLLKLIVFPQRSLAVILALGHYYVIFDDRTETPPAPSHSRSASSPSASGTLLLPPQIQSHLLKRNESTQKNARSSPWVVTSPPVFISFSSRPMSRSREVGYSKPRCPSDSQNAFNGLKAARALLIRPSMPILAVRRDHEMLRWF